MMKKEKVEINVDQALAQLISLETAVNMPGEIICDQLKCFHGYDAVVSMLQNMRMNTACMCEGSYEPLAHILSNINIVHHIVQM